MMKKIKANAKYYAIFLSMSILLLSCVKDAPLAKETKSTSLKYSPQDIFEALYFYDGKLANDMPSVDSRFINRTLGSLKKIKLKESTDIKTNAEKSEYDRYVDFKNYVYNYIEKNHPDQLSEFVNKMSSGDHYQIVEASSDLSNLYIEAVLASTEYAPYFHAVWEKIPEIDLSILTDENGEFNFEYFEANVEKIKSHVAKSFDTTANLNFVTVLLAAVVVVVVAVAGYGLLIGAGAAVVTWLVVGDEMKSDGRTFSMENEMMINDFAELLAE